MKKTYKIDVDCANCANKMEDAAKNTAGVKDGNPVCLRQNRKSSIKETTLSLNVTILVLLNFVCLITI